MTAKTFAAAALALGLAAAFAAPAAASGGGAETRRILTCGNVDTNISMVSRYVERVRKSSVKKAFKTEFEVEHRQPGYVVGQPVTVSVAGVPVGTRKLVRQTDGSLVADLELESEMKSFPATFPAVPKGTLVEVATKGATVLSCVLK